ncbi:hypothetical protein QTP88_012223 [Uroleucon formosanum]
MGLPRWLSLLALVAVVADEHERYLDVSESTPVDTRIGLVGDGSKDSGPPYLILSVTGSAVDMDLIEEQDAGAAVGQGDADVIHADGDTVERYDTQRHAIVASNVNNVFRLSSHLEKNDILGILGPVDQWLPVPGDDDRLSSGDRGIRQRPALRQGCHMTVTVTVLDVNDNQPAFNYTTVSSSILQVQATHVDGGDNGVPLDCETREVHELVVVAKDRGDQTLATTAFIKVCVVDINLIFLSAEDLGTSAAQRVLVDRISIHDPDSKQEYSDVTLQGGDGHFGLTTLNHIVYLVIVALPLDSESRPNYTLSEIATGTDSPLLHSSKTFHLLVRDVSQPVFAAPEHWTSMFKTTEPGTSMARVLANDDNEDEGDNAALTYKMCGTLPLWFQVYPLTGVGGHSRTNKKGRYGFYTINRLSAYYTNFYSKHKWSRTYNY